MLVIVLSVILRILNQPLLGDYIIVELLMVILVMTGLSYTQELKGHISIGLLVDKFSKRKQEIMNIIGYFLTVLLCIFTCIVNLLIGIKRFEDQLLLQIINIPIYPFIFVVSIGFFVWGIVAFTQLVKSIAKLRKGAVMNGG
jgi:TRAP-type C4-dicarboxylate transport system permease small subunit